MMLATIDAQGYADRCMCILCRHLHRRCARIGRLHECQCHGGGNRCVDETTPAHSVAVVLLADFWHPFTVEFRRAALRQPMEIPQRGRLFLARRKFRAWNFAGMSAIRELTNERAPRRPISSAS